MNQCMSPCEFAAMVTGIACCIAKGKCQEDIEVLAAFFTQLGDTLATITVYEANCCSCNEEADDVDEAVLG